MSFRFIHGNESSHPLAIVDQAFYSTCETVENFTRDSIGQENFGSASSWGGAGAVGIGGAFCTNPLTALPGIGLIAFGLLSMHFGQRTLIEEEEYNKNKAVCKYLKCSDKELNGLCKWKMAEKTRVVASSKFGELTEMANNLESRLKANGQEVVSLRRRLDKQGLSHERLSQEYEVIAKKKNDLELENQKLMACAEATKGENQWLESKCARLQKIAAKQEAQLSEFHTRLQQRSFKK